MESDFKVYKPSVFSIVAILFFCGLGILVGAYLVTLPYWLSMPSTDTKDYYPLCAIGMILVLLCGYILFTKTQFKIETSTHQVRITGLWGVREYDFSEIEGYRYRTDRYGVKTFYLCRKGRGRTISFNLDSQKKNELSAWINQNFTDLDARDAKEESDEALRDERLGSDEKERRKNLERARKIIGILGGTGMITGLWAIFWPHPFELIYWILILVPALAIVAPLFFPGSVRFIVTMKTIYGSTFLAFPFAAAFLFIRSTTDWKILDTTAFWPLYWMVTFVLSVLLILCSANPKKDLKTYLTAFVICAVYSAGAIRSLNGLLDQSTPATYPSQIVHKRISGGRSTSYYVTLAPWGPMGKGGEVEVNRDVYYSHPRGEQVTVYLRPGFFKIPWYSF